MFSLDGGGLIAAVSERRSSSGSRRLDISFVSEKGLVPDIYSHCTGVSLGHHGMIWLPKRSEVGDEAYRKEYVKHAERFCTCEFGGEFLCIKTALDDKPRKETLGIGPGTLDYGGPKWSDRKYASGGNKPTRLDDDRGSGFWSVKYKWGPSYWIPPSRSSAGKRYGSNLVRFFAVPSHGLYSQPSWLQGTLLWCKDMFTTNLDDLRS